ncbi:hypothetical protein JW916_15650, partial [Candidatus Sumerlaeota bacterium]|nr:hypothetical protein [Candidatus Sumerlaeota bacterium]
MPERKEKSRTMQRRSVGPGEAVFARDRAKTRNAQPPEGCISLPLRGEQPDFIKIVIAPGQFEFQ